MDLAEFTSERIQLYILVFVRITAIMALLPVFGSIGVSSQLRAGFSLLLAILLAPFVHIPPDAVMPHNIMQFVFAAGRETFVGICIGFTTLFLFSAVQFAGQIIDQETGFSMIELYDPFGEDVVVTVNGQLLMLLFSIIFLLVNGHYFLLLAAQKSFEVIPLMGAHFPMASMSAHYSRMIADVFVLAMRFAAPVFVILVLTSLSFAIVARTVPQMNVYFVGMPVKIVVGLFSLSIVLPLMVVLFRDMVQWLITDLYKIIYMMA